MLDDFIYTYQYRGSHPGWRPDGDDVCITETEHVIYAHTTLVPELFANPPKRKFVLVTESGDIGLLQDPNGSIYVGNKYVITAKIDKIPENCIRWYAEHANVIHPKISCLPLGTSDTTIDKIKQINLNKNTNGVGKTNLCYANFRIGSNPNDRIPAMNICASRGFLTAMHCDDIGFSQHTEIAQDIYLENVAKSKFVVCPEGAGVDTYRFWESLYLGSIPVVKNNYWIYNFNLPVVIVNDWYELNEPFLNEKWNEIFRRICNNEYCFDQIKFSYWLNRIKKQC